MALEEGNTIIDNSEHLKMADILRAMLNPEEYDECMIATGFWDIPGMALIYSEMHRFLDAGKIIRLIIGSTPEVKAYQLEKGFELSSHPEKTITRSLEELFDKLKDEYKDVIKLLMNYCNCEDETKGKIIIKKYGDAAYDQFLHAKCYIVRRKKTEQRDGCAKGIIGSSNFTSKGLTENAELNYFESDSAKVVAMPGDYSNVKGHIAWFEEIWSSELAKDWTGTFVEILKSSKPGKTVDKDIIEAPVSPYEAYIRILQEEYGSLLDAKVANIIKSYLPEAYQEFDYQIQGVQWCAHIMQQFNGFMLSDVVGLGKTVVGVLLAKYYVEVLAPQMKRSGNVLIIAPPAILKDWKTTIEDFDDQKTSKLMSMVKLVSIGGIDTVDVSLAGDDLSDMDDDDGTIELDDKTTYGLILIDESHRFRHSHTEMYKSLDELIDRHPIKPFVGLISATPQNNEPQDLYNQIKFFERIPRDSHFEKVEAGNIEKFFSDMRKKYQNLKTAQTESMTEEEKTNIAKELIDMSEEIRDKVLYDIMVRRTRNDIARYYKSTIKFPVINGPNNIEYNLDGSLAELFDDTIQKLVGMPVRANNVELALNSSAVLGFYRYRATEFLISDEDKSRYESGSIKVHDTSVRLANIMKILLVKRLESSFVAFKESLQNLKQYTQNMIDMWEHNAIFICPQIDVNKEFQRVRDEAEQANQWNDNFEKVKIRLEDKIQELNSEKRNPKERNHCYTRDMFKKEYIDKLRCDLRMIDYLYTRWQAETYDPKFEAFKDALRGDLFDVVKNGPQKLVIFTEAIATANVLQRYIERAKHKSLVITAKNRNEMRKKIKENFDANYKGERKDEYDVLITTDVLAEGINLHRANTILNYDTPWNATRLIQRIGRVNRIGSEHSEVYVYNFYPSDQGNRQINLKQNAFAKLQAFHAQFGGDNKIYSEAEMIPETDYNHWLDEVDGGESPVQTHIRNLKEYKEREPLRYEALCKKARDIVVAYDANCDESYHVVKKSASAAGGFGVRISGNTAKHIPMLDLLEHIKDAPNLSNLGGVRDVNNVDFNKLIFDEYNRIVHKQIADVNNKDVTAALALIHDWKHKFKLSQETQERLYAIRKLIEGGDNSAIKAILKLSKQLEIGELFPEAKINQTIKEFTQIVHNALLDEEPYLLASVYQVTSAIG